MIAIQPFEKTDEEYNHLVATLAACWPEYSDDLDDVRFWDETREPGRFYRRFTLLWGEEKAGIGTCFKPRIEREPGSYGFDLLVLPRFRRRGIGSAFYDFFLPLLVDEGFNPTHLSIECREDQPEGLNFLKKRGFEITMRFPRSALETASFDPQRFDDAVQRAAASGIAIRSLAEQKAIDPDALRKFWQFSEIDVMRDVPLPGPYKSRSFELFCKQIVENPRFTLVTTFVAVDGERLVGMSAVYLENKQNNLWMTGLTGIDRNYRRRGIATALKVRAITNARAAGAVLIETDNEENNPMYDLNLQLGFKPLPAWLELERYLPGKTGNPPIL